jgi:hypothetical protein
MGQTSAQVNRPVLRLEALDTGMSFLTARFPALTFAAAVMSGGVLAVTGLACHSSSTTPPTTTSPTSGAAVTLSSSALTFTGLGTQSSTLTNSGTAVLTISSIVAGGNFTESDNCVGSVAVGATCTINVTFVLVVGSPGGSAGTVTITDNASDSPETITLSGPVVANANGVFSPPSLTFATQAVGTTSSSQAVMLTNSANFAAALVVASITTTPDFTVVQNTCISSLPSGASCMIFVAFTPTQSGLRTGTLNVFDNAQGNLQVMQLTGTGR